MTHAHATALPLWGGVVRWAKTTVPQYRYTVVNRYNSGRPES